MNKKKLVVFTLLAVISAASSAPIAANPDIRPIFIVLPLVAMGIFLFFAGYYAAKAKNEQ